MRGPHTRWEWNLWGIAYWFHQVATVHGPAISLSVVSPSSIESKIGQVYWAAQTIWEEIEWEDISRETRLFLARSFCLSLVDEVKAYQNLRRAWRWMAQYEHSRRDRAMPWGLETSLDDSTSNLVWHSLEQRFQQLAQMIRTIPEPDLVDLVLGDSIEVGFILLAR